MASVYGTAFANFTPNVTGGSELSRFVTTIQKDIFDEEAFLKKLAGPVFNITEYGAVADTSDSRAAIQAAIDACAAAGGGIVYVPKGSFRIGSPGIVINSPYTRLVGQGPYLSILQPTISFTTGYLVTISKEFCQVTDIMLTGSGILTNALYIYEAPRFVANNVWIGAVSAGGVGITLEGTASNTSSHGGQYSNIRIMLLPSTGTGIECKSYTYDCQWSNVWVAYGQNCIILRDGAHAWTNFHAWGANGICVEVRAPLNRFTNGYIESSATTFGVYVYEAANTSFDNVYVWKNHASGIYALKSPSMRVVNCTVVDNNFQGAATQAGILLENSSNCVFVGNKFGRGPSFKDSKTHIKSDSLSLNHVICNNIMLAADATLNILELPIRAGSEIMNNVIGTTAIESSYILHQSPYNVSNASTGVVEVLATIVIPAGRLNNNTTVRLNALFDVTSSSSSRALHFRINGTFWTGFTITSSSVLSARVEGLFFMNASRSVINFFTGNGAAASTNSIGTISTNTQTTNVTLTITVNENTIGGTTLRHAQLMLMG